MLGLVDIEVRELQGATQAEAVTQLLADVWGTPYESAPIPGDVVASIATWGGCVLGAFDGEELVGVTVGLAAAPNSTTLASLIAGVLPRAKGTGVGRALKEAQRRWAAERGVTAIEWTYDPLVRRNARFNLVRLGGDVVSYHVEHYPPIPDGINAGDPTDRLLVRWDVRDAAPRDALDAETLTAAGGVVVLDEDAGALPRLHDRPEDVVWLAGTPSDVETLRRTDREASLHWRRALREVFLDAFATGRRVTGFTSSGAYVLTPDTTPDTAPHTPPHAGPHPTATAGEPR